MRLSQLLERLEYEVVQGTEDIAITTLINDSRKVEPGSMYQRRGIGRTSFRDGSCG